MRIFALFVIVLFVAGCGVDNPIQSGPTDAPSRISLDSDGSDSVAEHQLMPAQFDNPLSSFDFDTIDGGLNLEPDEVYDPEGTGDSPTPEDTDVDDDALEPEVIEPEGDDEPEPDSDNEPDSDDDLEPEVVGGGDPDSGAGGDVDEFGIEVVE